MSLNRMGVLTVNLLIGKFTMVKFQFFLEDHHMLEVAYLIASKHEHLHGIYMSCAFKIIIQNNCRDYFPAVEFVCIRIQQIM